MLDDKILLQVIKLSQIQNIEHRISDGVKNAYPGIEAECGNQYFRGYYLFKHCIEFISIIPCKQLHTVTIITTYAKLLEQIH